ncbi:MAG: vanadium-dependent haloperoxidase [Pseudomonadota bacterium]
MIKNTILILTFSCALCLVGANALSQQAQVATQWNAALLEIAEAEDGFMTLKGVRTAAMMHTAMHDALSAIDGDFMPYASRHSASDADAIVATVQAAFVVGLDQYPDQRERLAALRDDWLKRRGGGVRFQSGLELGRAVALEVLNHRRGDGWDTESEYRWHPMAPGVYAEFQEHSGTPQGFVFGAGWAKARGFAMQNAGEFRVPPPPAIESDAYLQAFREVKEMGRFQSMSRTPDQTHIAMWWKEFVESSHNRLARELIHKENLALNDAVRMLALLNMAVFDAYVSSFDNKFHYNHWRPYTAIRWAANDGNSNTQAETTWTNTHRHTYAFPSYPSAHGTACAAAMAVFKESFGDSYAFSMDTPGVDIAGPGSGKIEMSPRTRQFESFDQAAMQCGLSRVYLGIHFRYDATEGVRLGERVGETVISRLLSPRN